MSYGCGGVGSVFDELSASDRYPMFTTLVSLVEKAGLQGELKQNPSVYLLCPTNLAFERVNIEKLDVRNLVLRHCLTSQPNSGEITAESGEKLVFETDSNNRTTVKFGKSEACVLMKWFGASNGGFAGIGRVLDGR